MMELKSWIHRNISIKDEEMIFVSIYDVLFEGNFAQNRATAKTKIVIVAESTKRS
jgi:hypothetical protein